MGWSSAVGRALPLPLFPRSARQYGNIQSSIELQSGPEFLRPPSCIGRCAFVECVPEPPRLCRVAEVRLLNRVRYDDDEAEVLAGNGILEVIYFRAQLEVRRVVGACDGFPGWWCFE